MAIKAAKWPRREDLGYCGCFKAPRQIPWKIFEKLYVKVSKMLNLTIDQFIAKTACTHLQGLKQYGVSGRKSNN